MKKQGAATQHEVQIDGETCLVWVGQGRGSTWRAYGDFRNRLIDKTGRDELAGIERCYFSCSLTK